MEELIVFLLLVIIFILLLWSGLLRDLVDILLNLAQKLWWFVARASIPLYFFFIFINQSRGLVSAIFLFCLFCGVTYVFLPEELKEQLKERFKDTER